MSGKGSKRRPLTVSQDAFNANWDEIFRKGKPKPVEVKNEDENKKPRV